MEKKFKTEQQWRDQAKRLLKTELAKQGITYRELAERLNDIGIKDSEPNIRNRISRGKFSVVFFCNASKRLAFDHHLIINIFYFCQMILF